MRKALCSWWQKSRLHSWWEKIRSWFGGLWQKIKQHLVVTSVVVLLVLILFILLAYLLRWDWTGLNSGTSQITITSTSKGNYTATISQPSKSLWDWLQLLGVLAIPVVVGFGAAWFTAQQDKVSERENKDNQRETALQAYIDKMSELILEKTLHKSAEDDVVRNIALVRTLTVIPRLDVRRNRIVIKFLHDSRLLEKGTYSIDLSEVDLFSADLSGADLSRADLSRANLRRAQLYNVDLREAFLEGASLDEANLSGANLMSVDLSRASLQGADLWLADLSGADLSGADLSRAKLKETNLSKANLSGAIVTKEQLGRAKSTRGATMPDGLVNP